MTTAEQVYACQRYFLSPFPADQRGIFVIAGFFHDLFECFTVLLRQLSVIDLQLLAHDMAEHIQEGSGSVQGFLHGLYHFQRIGIIRGAFAVIFVGIADIMQDGVPCFMRDVAEKIFFLYL